MKDPIERRALLALYRNHPATQPGERYKWKAMVEARDQRDLLLAWAATMQDEELLWMRNLGPVALRWIRANQPVRCIDCGQEIGPGMVPCPTPGGIVQRAHTACCWCGEHHEEGR